MTFDKKNFLKYLIIAREHYALFASIVTVLFFFISGFASASYLAQFNLNIFDVTSFSEVYRISFPGFPTFSLILMGASFIASAILNGYFGTSQGSAKKSKQLDNLLNGMAENNLRRENIKSDTTNLIVFLTLLAAGLALIAASTVLKAADIKRGYTERYDITSDKEVLFKCISLIATTSDNLVFFNPVASQVTVLSRAKVDYFSQVVPSPPRAKKGPLTQNDRRELNTWQEKIKLHCN